MTENLIEVQLAEDIGETPTEDEFVHWASVAQETESVHPMVIRIVDEEEGRALNYDYRDRDYPTNVLSFPFEAPEGIDEDYLGDLVICAPVVRAEARAQGKEEIAHWAHMVVHGTLHLRGFDHIEAAEAEVMEMLEKQIMARLGYADPYQEEV